MRRTGLELQKVSAACMVAAPPGALLRLCLCGELGPDLVLVSRSLKRIGRMELCPPFDSQSELLSAAHQRKLGTYGPLLEALRPYVECGWQERILPWAVGVRGMIDAKSVSKILDFLQVARDRRAKIAEDVANESVEALHSFHQMRYQALRLNAYQASTRSSKVA
jgi:hypothetical protein